MSENKIFTLHLPAGLEDSLLEDRDSFCPSMNKSTFISLVIQNYHEQFNAKYISLKKIIIDSINKEDPYNKFNRTNYNNIVWSIVEYIEDSRLNDQKKEKKDRKINFRLNTKSNAELDEILLNSMERSNNNSYIRSILTSYLNLPKAERERIVFKQTVKKIEDALKKNCKIRLTTKNNRYVINPIEIYSSKEQLFNYLIYEKEPSENHSDRKLRSIHIKNIEKADLLIFEEKELSENYKIKVERMIRNGVQFGFEDCQFKVKFTENGKKQFDASYLEKPDPVLVDEENRIYTFDCTPFQFKRYFAPFYNEMEILEPESEIEKIKNILEKTYKQYE